MGVQFQRGRLKFIGINIADGLVMQAVSTTNDNIRAQLLLNKAQEQELSPDI